MTERARFTVEVEADEYVLGIVRSQIEELSGEHVTVEIVDEEPAVSGTTRSRNVDNQAAKDYVVAVDDLFRVSGDKVDSDEEAAQYVIDHLGEQPFVTTNASVVSMEDR